MKLMIFKNKIITIIYKKFKSLRKEKTKQDFKIKPVGRFSKRGKTADFKHFRDSYENFET